MIMMAYIVMNGHHCPTSWRNPRNYWSWALVDFEVLVTISISHRHRVLIPHSFWWNYNFISWTLNQSTKYYWKTFSMKAIIPSVHGNTCYQPCCVFSMLEALFYFILLHSILFLCHASQRREVGNSKLNTNQYTLHVNMPLKRSWGC